MTCIFVHEVRVHNDSAIVMLSCFDFVIVDAGPGAPSIFNCVSYYTHYSSQKKKKKKKILNSLSSK